MLDDFNRTWSGGSYSAGDAWSGPEHYSIYENDFTSPTLQGPLVIPYDTSIDSSLGTGAHGWTSNPGLGCTGLDFTFTGWFTRSFWRKYTVPAHPANVAGLTFGPQTFIAPTGLSGGTVGQLEGALLTVRTGQPTQPYDGTAVGTLPNGVSTTLFIPGALVPEEGAEMWVGVIPNWNANYGGYTCGFRWPWMDGQGNSAKCFVNESPTLTWQTWDGTADDWGAALDSDVNGAWWDGNLPWNIVGTGGTFGYDGDNIYLTVPAGSQQSLTATMEGASLYNPDDDSELSYGEPWTEDNGVRMKARFKLTTAGSTTESGTRQMVFEWHDGRELYTGTVHLGDTNKAQGVELTVEGSSTYLAKDIEEGSWHWFEMDTRNPYYPRARMWKEGGAYGSGEGASYDVQLEVADDSEAPSSNNFLRLFIQAGNMTGADQTVQVDTIMFCGAGEDCDWVEERIGQGDGTTNTYYTSQPYKPQSLWFFVDGHHVRTTALDYNLGKFMSVDTLPAPDNGIMTVRYLVDRNPDGD